MCPQQKKKKLEVKALHKRIYVARDLAIDRLSYMEEVSNMLLFVRYSYVPME